MTVERNLSPCSPSGRPLIDIYISAVTGLYIAPLEFHTIYHVL